MLDNEMNVSAGYLTMEIVQDRRVSRIVLISAREKIVHMQAEEEALTYYRLYTAVVASLGGMSSKGVHGRRSGARMRGMSTNDSIKSYRRQSPI